MEEHNAEKNIILLNLEREKILFDIKNTKKEVSFLLKSKWLDEWQHYIDKAFPKEANMDMVWLSRDEILSWCDKYDASGEWFTEILVEVGLFNPYFSIGNFDKALSRKIKLISYKTDYLDSLFLGKSYYSSIKAQNIKKSYDKAFNKVDDVIRSNKIGNALFYTIFLVVACFSFTVFFLLFGGVSRISVLFSLLGSLFGLIGALSISFIVSESGIISNKEIIVSKAKKETLKIVSSL